jgi:hypothetical protein
MSQPKNRSVDVIKWKPHQGKEALHFCWHDRAGIELQTEDGRVIATYHHKQLRPCNPEIWATYFKPGVEIH